MPRLRPVESPVTIELDGHQLPAREGESVAAALLAHDEFIFARSPKYHRPRGPYCMSGECSQCLMRVDGVPNVATCCTPVRPGMRVEHQNAMPDRKLDFLRVNDFVFRDWFNHHEFLAGVPIAEDVLREVARKLSGLGTLPESAPAPREPAVTEALPLVIVGAGAAGLAAAERLEALGQQPVVFEREARVGGRLAIGLGPAPAWAPRPERLRLRAQVVGLFADDGRPFLAVLQHRRLHFVFFERLLLAVGGHPAFPTFPNNDLPGVMSGRAVARLVHEDGVLPGRTIACVGDTAEAEAVARLVTAAGARAVAVGARVERAHGLRRVSAVTVTPGGRVGCDVVAVCEPPSPAFELARAAGAKVTWDEAQRTFLVEADEEGRTARRAVWVAGEARGRATPEEAAAQGRRAAESIARATP
jgi:sarcosine oxidase subunit alpha